MGKNKRKEGKSNKNLLERLTIIGEDDSDDDINKAFDAFGSKRASPSDKVWECYELEATTGVAIHSVANFMNGTFSEMHDKYKESLVKFDVNYHLTRSTESDKQTCSEE